MKKAFQYFIDNYNNGRPFIIASHSQGSRHGLELLKQEIDGKKVSERMIAAYMLGMGTITNEAVAGMNIPVCDSPYQTGCLIHWATYGEHAAPDMISKGTLVCVNPLSWRRDGDRVGKNAHLGYVSNSGKFTAEFSGDDAAVGMIFDPLDAPQEGYTWAYCKDGRLLIEEQAKEHDTFFPGNYHGLDFQMFHMNIRKNIGQRVRAYLK